MTLRYLEDFAVGQTFGSGRLWVEKERIKSFAAEFDPQPFHLDEDAARRSIFGGLVASGWHAAALTMRLLVESELRPAGERPTNHPHPLFPPPEREGRSTALRTIEDRSAAGRGH